MQLLVQRARSQAQTQLMRRSPGSFKLSLEKLPSSHRRLTCPAQQVLVLALPRCSRGWRRSSPRTGGIPGPSWRLGPGRLMVKLHRVNEWLLLSCWWGPHKTFATVCWAERAGISSTCAHDFLPCLSFCWRGNKRGGRIFFSGTFSRRRIVGLQ